MPLAQGIEQISKDVQFAVRAFRKAPGFMLAATLTLALGIGANTAVYSIVDAALLRPPPYKDPDRLVAIWNRNVREKGPSKLFDSYRDFVEYGRAASFESIGAATWAAGGQVMTNRGLTKEILAIPVSSSFFPTLGVEASLGRTFLPDDEKRGCAVVLADRFWQSTLGADAAIVGQSLTLNGRSCTIVGVMPRGFSFYPAPTQLWILLGPDFKPAREQLNVGIFARLKPGVTPEQAQSEVEALYRALHQSDRLERDLTPVVSNLQSEFTWLASRTLRTTLFALSGAVILVLLIACINVANLLLGRAIGRERELAVRAAIGAGRRRLIRQLLTEGFLLAVGGGGLGVLLAVAAIRYFRYLSPIELPVGAEVTINQPVLIFTALLSLLTTLLFASGPAWRASRVDLNRGLKAGGRNSVQGGSRPGFLSLLVIAETALSVALLAGAALLIESVLRMSVEPLGFDPEHLVTMRANLPQERYSDPTRRLVLCDMLERRISAVAGVTAVGLSSSLPPFNGRNEELEIAGQAAEAQRLVAVQAVGAGNLAVLKVPLLAGRRFDNRDAADSEQVALISETVAREYFSGMDPVGRRIRLAPQPEKNPWLTVVGVVGDVKGNSLYREMSWEESKVVYRPLAQDPPRSIWISARVAGDFPGIGENIQREIALIDPSIPVGDIQMMSSRVSATLAYPRFRALVFGGFAAFALLLAAVGLYGVLGQFVGRRRPEFALRMAIGAPRTHLLWLVGRQGGIPVIAGLLAGLACALGLTRGLASLLYGVRPAEPRTLIGVSLTLLLVAAIAMAVPAHRAATVDPMHALRDE